MDFTANKQSVYEKRISSLPDQPNMQPDELKKYFDSSPEEIRQAHNALCDALTAATSAVTAAANLGFQRTAGVPADNVQDAIEDVQAQLDAAVMGNIPSGSVTQDKLAQDVRDRFAAIESAAAAESSTRASADSQMQSQLSTHTTQIAAKCQLYCGTYTGNGETSQFINLGFTPKAVLVFPQDALVSRNPYPVGALALQGYKAFNDASDILEIISNGFQVYYFEKSYGGCFTNVSNYSYFYLAFQ